MTAAAIRHLNIPSADELVERARAMVPEIRALAGGQLPMAEFATIQLRYAVILNWDAVGTMNGQHAFGLEPRGQY